jgi:PhzF family phenazine biosynthesis protein
MRCAAGAGRSLAILQVDAFTARPFSGNPAGVVLDADGLSLLDLRRVAAEMNCAETAFLVRPAVTGADLRLRWFTPTGQEIAFCGHATVATVHALVEAGRLARDRIVFDTLGGLLPVRIERGRDGPTIWLEPKLPRCSTFSGGRQEVLSALGLPSLAGWAQPAVSSDGDVLLPMPALAALRALAPEMGRLATVATAAGLRGLCCVSLETVDPGSRTHCRFFAPHVGIPEDVVTGSVHAAIPIWLWEAGVLDRGADSVRFTAEQGDTLGRPGRLAVELQLDGGRPAAVRVGGRAVAVLSGTIRLE